jgi:hypothetical protein
LALQGSNDDMGSNDGVPDLGSGVDMETFDQILEMDDDTERSFSKSLFIDFVSQASETFSKMEENLYAMDFLFSWRCFFPFLPHGSWTALHGRGPPPSTAN